MKERVHARTRNITAPRQAKESGAVGFLLKDAPAAELATAIRPLTRREQEVLAVALDGASITEIAARLVVSEGTVRNHISTAIQKLGAQNRMEAARLAEQKGWL